MAALLDGKREEIEARRQKLAVLAERCISKSFPVVMTHGDAGGNCIFGKNGVTLIDWDTAGFSVPERDAWVYMCSDGNIGLIEKGLAAGGFEYRPDTDAMGYFANAYFFEYMGNYMQSALDASGEELQELYDGLKDYFGCWITSVLEYVDRQVL